MKKHIITGLFFTTIGTAVLASPYSSIYINQYNLPSIVPNSYIRGVLSQGEVTRWNPETFPLRVYIQSGAPVGYIQQIKKAYSRWQTITDGNISFVFVNSPEDADMKCYFKNELANVSDDTVGYHQFRYYGDYISDSVINFRLTDKYGRDFTPNMIYTVALHEIGHSLGLAGHSSNPNDLMYPISKERKIDVTKRDLTTLKLLYMINPDITNEDFSKDEIRKLLTKTQVVGGESRLKQDAETAAKINSEITPDDPTSKIRLATAYKNNKNYSAAIKEFKSIIPLVDSDEIKSAIYCEMTECYIAMKNFVAAKNCATYANNNYPNQETEVLLPKIYYANGQKQLAVKNLLPLWNEDKNPYAGHLLKQIYEKEQKNPTIKKLIETGLKG